MLNPRDHYFGLKQEININLISNIVINMNMQCNSTYSPRRGEESHATSSNTVHVSPIQQGVGVSHEASITPRRQIQVRSSIDADIGTFHTNVQVSCSYVNLFVVSAH